MKPSRADTKYEAACKRIRDLLRSWLESGIDLFIALREVETSGDWKLGGHDRFQDFLLVEFPDALGFDKYQRVMRAIDVYGLDFVKGVGVHCALAAADARVFESQKSIEKVKKRIREAMSSGRLPEISEVRKIVRQVSQAKVSPPKQTASRTLKPVPPSPIRQKEKEERLSAALEQGDRAVRELNAWLATYRHLNSQGMIRPIWHRVQAALKDQGELEARNN